MMQQLTEHMQQIRKSLRRAIDSFDAYLLRRRCHRLRTELNRKEHFSFSEDWFTKHQTIWQISLGDYANQPGLQVLEIGTFEGRSALWFLQNLCTQPDSMVSCIDIFRSDIEVRFDHNLRVARAGNRVRKHRGRSAEILPKLQGQSFDIIYIDGSHQAADVLLDASLCWRLLKTGGTLIFDDYLWEPEKGPDQRPQIAIDLFLEMTENQWQLLHRDYQILIRKTA